MLHCGRAAVDNPIILMLVCFLDFGCRPRRMLRSRAAERWILPLRAASGEPYF